MTFEDFCHLNGFCDKDIVVVAEHAVFPQGDFSPEFTMILYTSAGKTALCIDGHEYTARRKTISVWRPGNTINFQPSEDLRYKLLVISGNLQQQLNVGSIFLTMFVTDEYPVIRITSAFDVAMKHFFESIQIVCNFHENPYKTDCVLSILRALFFSTGYYVQRSLKFGNGDLYRFATEYSISEDSVVRRFINLVEQNAATNRHLSFYAAKLDYNPKYLSALIKRETGHSGQNLIDQYALLAAMAKLSYGHQSIKEISDQMNFLSQSDFGKFFRRLAGTSPLNYRKHRFSRDAR